MEGPRHLQLHRGWSRPESQAAEADEEAAGQRASSHVLHRHHSYYQHSHHHGAQSRNDPHHHHHHHHHHVKLRKLPSPDQLFPRGPVPAPAVRSSLGSAMTPSGSVSPATVASPASSTLRLPRLSLGAGPALGSESRDASVGTEGLLGADDEADAADDAEATAVDDAADADGGLDGSGAEAEAGLTNQPPRKKKQKRNKPTLSCRECVDRKTKCDRGRPHCLAFFAPHRQLTMVLSQGIKRQTECKYAHVANLLEETSRSMASGRRMTRPPKKRLATVSLSPCASAMTRMSAMRPPARRLVANMADRGALSDHDSMSRGAVALSTGLLSHAPYSVTKASNVFGIGSEHPFANYWTRNGGLPEVLSVLPPKTQVDALLARYFECVDSVYPMIHRQTFYADYEHFWQLGPAGRDGCDAAFAGLILVMLALGAQFIVTTGLEERKQTAEFYASAANQALRVASYLSSASLRSIQAMVLLTYFLINDNHASDGWAFSGILIRQAYAMGLHRDPNIVTPNANLFEKQQRRKVWQAVLLQDTFLTVLLALPPSSTHADVSVDDLLDDSASIASSDPVDTAYIRGSWMLANLVQEVICSPRALDLPICETARHKSKIVADFRAVYRSFPDVFRSWDAHSLTRLTATNKRIVRQTLWLTTNYFHHLMLVHASQSVDVPVNIRGTLEAAHDAIGAFFLMHSLLENEARVWWVLNHRAFLQALCIGNVICEVAKEPGGEELLARDALFARARSDMTGTIEILQQLHGDDGTAQMRVQILKQFLD
ncbi:hypothetical protein CDD81_4229 [Ophiocordyceps australis]|uniref:Xylanolytic transcriptional activator regulatory domain-containing protein n=1 Tax=Ophiocordyceps australis TaxID=1399860 RepID=A0A2C5XJ88_9HYPO|nr:hypothetical protein CDD81_4229 [Ophiocordyceps australis]